MSSNTASVRHPTSSPSAYTTVGGEGILAVASAAGSVSILSAKTLTKIRSVSLFQGSVAGAVSPIRRRIVAMMFVSGFRHFGDQMSTSGGSSVCLHVIDNCGAYYTICTKTFVVCVAPMPILRHEEQEGTITQAGWTMVSDQSASSHHHQSPSDLCVVCVTPSQGVIAVEVRALLPLNKTAPSKVAALVPTSQIFPPVTTTEAILLSTSLHSGILHIAQLGRRWIVAVQLHTVVASEASTGGGKQAPQSTIRVSGSPAHFLAPCDVHTLASHPTLVSGGVAVGGTRGEISLVANSTGPNPILFTDHWHFGPLTALSFTADGKTLLSGGAEQVLVSWNVGGSFDRLRVTRVFSAEGGGGSAASGEWSSASPIVGILSLGLTSLSCEASKGSAALTSVWGSSDAQVVYNGSASMAPALVLFGDSSLAAVDPLEHRTLATASGAQWISPPHSSGSASQRPCGQALTWKGRGAIMVCVGDCVRYCDPSTSEALHSAVVRFRPEASAIGLDGPAAPTALLATCTKDGKLLFTYEDLTPIGLPSVLKVWEYQVPSTARGSTATTANTTGRHVLIQSIAAPHGVDSRGMVALRVDEGPGRLRLFSADRGSIKCWAPSMIGAHELTSTVVENSSHNGGKATIWTAVGTSVFPSRRLSDISISADGSVCAACDDTVHFFAIASADKTNVLATEEADATLSLREAREWTRVLQLAQTHTGASLHNLDISGLEGGSSGAAAPRVVASSLDGKFIFIWALNVASGVWDYTTVAGPEGSSGFISAAVASDDDIVSTSKMGGSMMRIFGLVASAKQVGSQSQTFHVVELSSSSSDTSKKQKQPFPNVYTAKNVPNSSVVLSCSSSVAVACGIIPRSNALFIVDELGLQVVTLPNTSAVPTAPNDQRGGTSTASTVTATVSTYFQAPSVVDVPPSQGAAEGEGDRSGKVASTKEASLVALGVLAAEAYTCPAVATVLSALLNE